MTLRERQDAMKERLTAKPEPELEVEHTIHYATLVEAKDLRIGAALNQCIVLAIQHEGQPKHDIKRRAENARGVRRYLARRRGWNIQGSHTTQEWLDCLKAHNNQCVYCGSTSNLTRDHVLAISKGGSDSIDNIVPACRRCNSRKGNRW